ncbi:MAG: Gram-negative bacterial TonB protein C-terminal [Acidobacteriota bacterium]|nr:Gram-negative bacterial TonB protein C-terminal [Acidobacteriota bacterium]
MAYRGSAKPAGQDSVSIEQPEKIFGSQPQFKRSTGREGQVIVTAEIDEDGCVQDLKVTSGLNKYANQVVLDTFQDWVFRPATLLGQPVRVPNEWTVNVSFGRR